MAERVPLRKSILTPASQCSYCKTKLLFFELIPIIAILLLRFRCRHCKHKLSVSYFFSELICGFLFTITSFNDANSMYILFFLLTAFTLTLTDIFYLIVEPKIFYPFAVLVCLAHYSLGLPIHLFTGTFLFVSLFSFNFILPNSIGGGDILLVTLWGILLGNTSLIILLFVSSSSALLFLIFFRFIFGKKIQQLPFVPFLSFGLFFVLFCI
ncbi:hypothetical protein BCR23_09770 [Enterococcus quebecensis]|uniref:Uncharacterized protein n=1 Tax=Enterococcus quebecensis TaxID=903983 RepID=A0A1E5GRK4_9ENTE|nr:hypothetical protein BCR23_09770 [Enterococcus quebecensis]